MKVYHKPINLRLPVPVRAVEIELRRQLAEAPSAWFPHGLNFQSGRRGVILRPERYNWGGRGALKEFALHGLVIGTARRPAEELPRMVVLEVSDLGKYTRVVCVAHDARAVSFVVRLGGLLRRWAGVGGRKKPTARQTGRPPAAAYDEAYAKIQAGRSRKEVYAEWLTQDREYDLADPRRSFDNAMRSRKGRAGK